MKFLRFESEVAARAAFAVFLVDGQWPVYIGGVAVDVIGTIHKPTGAVLQTEEGGSPEFAPVPGWHINLSDRVSALSEFEISPPANPVRQFFTG